MSSENTEPQTDNMTATEHAEQISQKNGKAPELTVETRGAYKRFVLLEQSISAVLANIIETCDHGRHGLAQAPDPKQAAEQILGKVRTLAIKLRDRDLAELTSGSVAMMNIVGNLTIRQQQNTDNISRILNAFPNINESIGELLSRIEALEEGAGRSTHTDLGQLPRAPEPEPASVVDDDDRRDRGFDDRSDEFDGTPENHSRA